MHTFIKGVSAGIHIANKNTCSGDCSGDCSIIFQPAWLFTSNRKNGGEDSNLWSWEVLGSLSGISTFMTIIMSIFMHFQPNMTGLLVLFTIFATVTLAVNAQGELGFTTYM